MDDYLEKRLSRYDARQLERHLSLCSTCAEELRDRPRFERTIRHALAASVHQNYLSAEASIRIVREAQDKMRRAVWSNRVVRAARIAGSAVAVSLVLVGLFFLLRGFPAESDADTVTLFPVEYLHRFDRQPGARVIIDGQGPSSPQSDDLFSTSSPALSLGNNDVVIEPWMLQPGDTFTITMFLHTNLVKPLLSVRFDLDVNGPTGYYSFDVTVKGHLPSRGVSVLQITPDILAASSREKYLIAPNEIFSKPGVYTVSIFLYSPVPASTR
jgi:hypothetical protein